MKPMPKAESTDTDIFRKRLREIRRERTGRDRAAFPKARRQSFTNANRATIASKTDGRCHICGGVLDAAWEVDHVIAHGIGGRHQLDNYLPAHALCNNYRWHYLPEEFQWVLKIGVWARLIMEQETQLGKQLAERFCQYERARVRRRKSSSAPAAK